MLNFGDGSDVHVWAIPNDGSPRTVVFEPRTISSMTVQVVDRIGTQIGLAEIEVGYGGHDEDQGQMGGVSALMKLGLFSLRGTCSREPIYEITAPEFDEINISLDPRYYSGTSFSIKVYDQCEKNCYVQRAQLNGEPLQRCWLYHEQFAKGGRLELWLGLEPNEDWGTSVAPH